MGDISNCDDLICVGVIYHPHGLKGEVKIKTFTQQPTDVLSYTALFDKSGQSLKITSGRPFKDNIIIAKFAHLTDRNKSEAVKGQEIYIQRSQLDDQLLNPDEVFYQDLVGLKVINQDNYSCGKIIGVHNYGAGDLLEIKLFEKGEEIFVPFSHPDVSAIDTAAQTIIIDDRLIQSFKATPRGQDE